MAKATGSGTGAVRAQDKAGEERAGWYLKARATVKWIWARFIYLCWIAIIGAIAVFETGLIEAPADYVMAFYAGIVATMIAIHARELQHRLGQVDDQLQHALAALQKRDRLFRLHRGTQDAKMWLNALQPGASLTIEHLGLNLRTAWDEVQPVLTDASNRLHVTYRLLMLGGKAGRQAPKQVRDWIRSGNLHLPEVRDALEAIRANAKTPGTLDFEIRVYQDLPFIHGFRMREALSIAFIAISRWRGKKFDRLYWGPQNYRLVVEKTSSASDRDLMAVFDTYFQHWWILADGVVPTNPVQRSLNATK